jgi:AcrR family transcriptional regulator
MTDAEFDQALIASALQMAADRGWAQVTVAAAARHADLPLDMARRRFPGRAAILLRLGLQADEAAVTGMVTEAPVRETLFDMLMRRIDVFQQHRAGVLALFEALPARPAAVLLLADATRRSMGWMLEAAGVSTTGAIGALRVQGLVVVWLWTIRAWQRDDSLDLGQTMAALDKALTQAERAAPWLKLSSPEAPPPAEPPAPPEPEPDIVVPTDIPPPPPEV